MSQGFGKSTGSRKKGGSRPAPGVAVDAEQVQADWLCYFDDLADPRGMQGIEHPFLSIVMIAILATIGGAKGWEDIETYGEAHDRWLGSFLSLPKGIPRADTYRRLFERLEPAALENCFGSWVNQLVEPAIVNSKLAQVSPGIDDVVRRAETRRWKAVL